MMRSFFVEPSDIAAQTATVSGDDARHIIKVLRLVVGDSLRLFDSTGATLRGEITELAKERVVVRILEQEPAAIGKFPELHLGQALLKGDKMDFIVQKATELGASSITPFVSRYCVARTLAEKRLERWERISREACKQCNRPKPLTLHPPVDFEFFLEASRGVDTKIIFWEEETTRSLASVIAATKGAGSVLVMIGPEGGFSVDEADRAKAAGWQAVTMGSRILRAETAAVAAVAILQYMLGNLNR